MRTRKKQSCERGKNESRTHKDTIRVCRSHLARCTLVHAPPTFTQRALFHMQFPTVPPFSPANSTHEAHEVDSLFHMFEARVEERGSPLHMTPTRGASERERR